MFQKMMQGGSGSSGKNIELLTIEGQKAGGNSKIEFTLNPEIITTPSKVAFAFGLGGNLFSNFEKQNGEVIINDYISNSNSNVSTYSYTISDNKVSTELFSWSGSPMKFAGMACLYE